MTELLQKYGLSRTKLAIIAGLVVLLAAVWGNAFLSGRRTARPRAVSAQGAKPTSGSEQPSKRSGFATTSDSPSATQPTDSQRALLPPVDMSRITRQDPFARPAWAFDGSTNTEASSVSLGEREATLEQIKSTGVSAVVLSDGKKIATVGGQRVRPGDTLLGYRVLDITPSGIVLSDEPADNSPF